MASNTLRIAVCAIVRNEARHLPEWLSFHFAAGFSAAIVFDNGSTDGTREVLRRAGICKDVRVLDWPFSHNKRQVHAYTLACGQFAGEFDRLAFIDIDEFIVPPEGVSIGDFVASLPGHDLLALNWAMFGSSGHIAEPPGLVIESYTRRAPNLFGPGCHAKCIVRPEAVEECVNPHFFRVPGPEVNALGEPVSWQKDGLIAGDTPLLEPCRVNHYFTRSKESWERRMARGQVSGLGNRSWKDFEDYDRNEVEDRRAAERANLVKKGIQGLGAT